ncbi:uncharacterized protein MELLADRAFT_62878 [Melampsora larici-populina 98AG31]|uniref:Large ribosomal subunit protein mL46 n=1 Tax=Melampsora larici-populina (strain 98AG31 / pathotype 3-4-7) TaxID=747676 RepID=F4RKK8_MELLP|nr:uncharacterized protein MELLADRAFT_62878 [Melampsora larici-populina 98AG31]EGG07111.1 hypothetical protein MELLADRAFT_62878 [Melampsora larici-populina 98AG31]
MKPTSKFINSTLLQSTSLKPTYLSKRLSTESSIAIRPRSSSIPPPIPLHQQSRPSHRLVVASLVSRLPITLKKLTRFESAYYHYQSQLSKTLETKFNTSFFFRSGSQAEKEFLEESTGKSNQVDASVDQHDHQTVDQLDLDESSLERKKDQTLYLLVKKNRSEHQWQLPQGGIKPKEDLVKAGLRELYEELGIDMDIFSIGHVPASYYSYESIPSSLTSTTLKGTKVWIMPKRILRGQPKITEVGKSEGIIQFAWLTKDEIQNRVSQELWSGLNPILSEI